MNIFFLDNMPREMLGLFAAKLPPFDIVAFSRVSKLMHKIAEEQHTFQMVSAIAQKTYTIVDTKKDPEFNFFTTNSKWAHLFAKIYKEKEKLFFIDSSKKGSWGAGIAVKCPSYYLDIDEDHIEDGPTAMVDSERNVPMQEEMSHLGKEYLFVQKKMVKTYRVCLHDKSWFFNDIKSLVVFPEDYLIVTSSSDEGVSFYAIDPSYKMGTPAVRIARIAGFYFHSAAVSVDGNKLYSLVSPEEGKSLITTVDFFPEKK